VADHLGIANRSDCVNARNKSRIKGFYATKDDKPFNQFAFEHIHASIKHCDKKAGAGHDFPQESPVITGKTDVGFGREQIIAPIVMY
jgi:hypothetical protein